MKAMCMLSVLAGMAGAIAGEGSEAMKPAATAGPSTNQFTLTSIGQIRKQTDKTVILLDPRYQEGLLGLEQWSHIWVIYWFDRNDTPEERSVLQVHPRGNRDNPLTGVFATRSPFRPNLVALSLCRVVSIRDGEIEIEGIDAFDKTPVIDIKPFARGIDRPSGNQAAPTWAGRPAD